MARKAGLGEAGETFADPTMLFTESYYHPQGNYRAQREAPDFDMQRGAGAGGAIREAIE